MPGINSFLVLMGMINSVNTGVESFRDAQSQKTSLSLQQNIAQRNAEIAELEEADIKLAGQRQEQRNRLRFRMLKASAKASGGHADIRGESFANTLKTLDAVEEFEVGTSNENTERLTLAKRIEKDNFKLNSNILGNAANNISPFIQGAGGLLTSAGQFGAKFLNRQIRLSGSVN